MDAVLTMNLGGVYGVSRSCWCNCLLYSPSDEERCTTVASVPWNLYTLYVPAFIIPLSSGRENKRAGQGGAGRGGAGFGLPTYSHNGTLSFYFPFFFLRG